MNSAPDQLKLEFCALRKLLCRYVLWCYLRIPIFRMANQGFSRLKDSPRSVTQTPLSTPFHKQTKEREKQLEESTSFVLSCHAIALISKWALHDRRGGNKLTYRSHERDSLPLTQRYAKPTWKYFNAFIWIKSSILTRRGWSQWSFRSLAPFGTNKFWIRSYLWKEWSLSCSLFKA